MADNIMLECALAYIAKGWRVLPLHSIIDGKCTCGEIPYPKKPGKHPYTYHGSTDGTTDKTKIQSWFGNGTPLNIGICTGVVLGMEAITPFIGDSDETKT